MSSASDNRIVLITRRTRLQELITRFNTVTQAQFYVEHAGLDFSDYLLEDQTYQRVLSSTTAVLSELGRLHVMDRTFLPNYVFSSHDIIVTLGQDGLVANTLKYLDGQPIVGVNPDPRRWDGALLPFQINDLRKLMPDVFERRRKLHQVTLAEVHLQDGQRLLAVNDLFVGVRGHSSARYIIHSDKASERHSSSGVIISTGLGSTGWLKSLINGASAVLEQSSNYSNSVAKRKLVNTAFPWNASHLCFTVREPFPSKTTGANIIFGQITKEKPLIIESLMAENGIIFSDGMEGDFLHFNSGTKAVITLSEKIGHLVA